MNNDDDGISIIETEGYSKEEEKLSIKQIILRHIRKISDISSKELTPSYWQKKPFKVGDGIVISEVYHEDLRESYINSIDFLLDMVMPYEDKKFTEILKILEEEQSKEFEKSKKYNKSQSEWTITKLKLKRKLFREIILMFKRIKFFEGAEDYGE